MSVADDYADLLALAHAGALPLPAEPFRATAHQTVVDPNKAVLSAYTRKDRALLQGILRWHTQPQGEGSGGEEAEETGLALF